MKFESIIQKMTLEEKAAMMSGKDVWSTKKWDQHGIPSMFLSDGPHGLRKQAGAGDHLGLNASLPATCYPTAATMANSWDESLGEELGEHLGKEAASLGVDVVLGPGLNMKRSPLCGRNFEYFSEDPYLAGKMAAAYIRGIQKNGVAACPKHFALNSQEERRMAMDAVADERTLRELYLTGFEIAIKEGKAKALMTSYNQVNGIYANEHPHLLGDILYKEWEYDGFVVSDWGGSNDHVEGVKQGSHLEMPSTGKMGTRQIVEAVKEGRLKEEILDQRVEELLNVVFATYQASLKEKDQEFDIEKHHKFARKAAAESIVLLKNQDNILPLKKDAQIALIGDFAQKPRYQGAGSSLVNPTKEPDSLLNSLQEIGIDNVVYQQGYQRNKKSNPKLIEQAVSLAKTKEIVILCVGLDEISESEGLDRTHLNMPKAQLELIDAISEVNKNIIVVLSAGSSISMPWKDKVKGILHGYLGGQGAGKAMADIIIGNVCPSGKLNETYPVSLESVPCNNYYPAKEKSSEYRESLYMGYRYFDTLNEEVTYPFGYGLSYTTFSYSDLKITGEKIQFKLKNTGSVAGAEVCQMYVGYQRELLFGPKKELKGFKKVFLQPGEEKEVEIPFDDKTFRYYNVETNQWEILGGTYHIYVGENVSSILLEGTLEKEASTNQIPYCAKDLPSYYSGEIKKVSREEFQKLYREELPQSMWDKSGELDENDAICQLRFGKSIVGKGVYWILTGIKNVSELRGKPSLNIMFIYNMPFRALSKMTAGAFNERMVKGLVQMINHHGLRGIRNFVSGIFLR